MVLISIGPSQARKRTRKRNRYGTERHVKNVRDLAIAEALRAQTETALVLLGQGAEDSAQDLPSLIADDLFLRIQTRILMLPGENKVWLLPGL
jgi:electron transfer flavoprotein alpha/beta subunit